MAIQRKLLCSFSILILVSFLGACSQQIQGTVFLDRNGNNVGDHGELAVSGLSYSVTLDDSPYSQGVTETGGKYLVILDKTQSEGTYCVTVDASSFTVPQATKAKNMASPKLLEESDEAEDSESCPFNINDEPNCNDAACCGEPECETAAVCEEEASDENEDAENKSCPTDANNEPICSDSRCANLAKCDKDVKTIQPMKACGSLAKTTMVMNLDVPISMDYSSRVEPLQNTYPTPVNIGDLIEIDITYPSSCTFELYSLPKQFYPEGLKGLYNEITREFSLDQAVHQNVSRVFPHDKPPLGHDKLHTYTLVLKVVEGVGGESSQVLIQPNLICPDGQNVQASANIIPFAASAEISVRSELTSPCPESGESAAIQTTLNNPTSSPLMDVVVQMDLSGSDHVFSVGDYPEGCLLKGESLECQVDHVTAQGSRVLTWEILMDDTVPLSSTLEVATHMDVAGATYSDAPIQCQY